MIVSVIVSVMVSVAVSVIVSVAVLVTVAVVVVVQLVVFGTQMQPLCYISFRDGLQSLKAERETLTAWIGQVNQVQADH